jgi:hypothetical protein
VSRSIQRELLSASDRFARLFVCSRSGGMKFFETSLEASQNTKRYSFCSTRWRKRKQSALVDITMDWMTIITTILEVPRDRNNLRARAFPPHHWTPPLFISHHPCYSAKKKKLRLVLPCGNLSNSSRQLASWKAFGI